MVTNYKYANYKVLGAKFVDEGQKEKALTYYKKAEIYPESQEDVDFLIDFGLVYEEMNEYDEALALFKKAIALDDEEARGYYCLGMVYDNKKEYHKAIDYYKRAIELDPYYEAAYFFLASCCDIVGDHEGAIHYYEKSISIDETDFWSWVNLGSIYEEEDENEKALEYFKEAVNLDPTHYMVLFNLGVVYNKMKKNEEAISSYRKAIMCNVHYPYSFLNLALIYKQEGRYEEALSVIIDGLCHNPGKSFLHYHKGCLLMHLDKNEKAKEAFVKAIDLHPDFVKYIGEDEELSPFIQKEEEWYKSLKNA